MYKATLECLGCGNRGPLELRCPMGTETSADNRFEYLGNSVSGYMHLLCTSCNAVLLVDPLEIIGPGAGLKTAKGVPCRTGSLLLRKAQNGGSHPQKANENTCSSRQS